MTGPRDPEPYVTDEVLRDGQTVRLRPIRPDDLDAMLALWDRLSPETIRLRFFTAVTMDASRLRHLVEVDGVDRFALVAVIRDRIAGVGRFERLPEDPSAAEFAVTVEDAEQGRGLGTALLRALLAPARDLGITAFHGEILKQNLSMLGVVQDAGLQPAIRDYGDMVSTTFTTSPTEALLERAGELGREAARNALTRIFSPRAIAVVGASRDRQSIGGMVLANLLAGGFSGVVYPVNPNTAHVQSVTAYPTLADCPTVPDTVIVCVPAAMAEAMVDEAGTIGARAAVLLGTGFSEAGPDGAAVELRVLECARRHGIRLIGPNCMGVLNATTATRLNATFSPVFPAPGRIGLSSQSGALGLAILAHVDRRGLGLSTFASIGNKVDISSNDLLQYWEADPDTDVIVLYLESFGNPRTFARVARRVGRRKPIVVVKAGRRRPDDAVVQALFDQTGVIRVAGLDPMFNVAALLTSQPLPAGPRVGIVSLGAGPAALAADACVADGLEVPGASPALRRSLTDCAPLLGPADNPVVLGPEARPIDVAAAVRLLATSGEVDALMVVVTPPGGTTMAGVSRHLAEAVTGLDLPVTAVFMTGDRPSPVLREAGIPTMDFPEGAAEALAHAHRYARWRRRPMGRIVTFDDADGAAVDRVLARATTVGRDPEELWLDADDVAALLQAVGIRCAPHRVVDTPQEAAAAQAELGTAVVVKPAAPVRRTEVGAVRLGLHRPEQIIDAVASMERDLRRRGAAEVLEAGWVVQQMVPDGVETTIAIRPHRTFGPVAELGLGGTLVELLTDRAVKVLPLTDVDVEDMVLQLRGHAVLTGYRGSPPVNVAGLQAVLLRLSALVEDHPQIAEVDLGPVFVGTHDVTVVDAMVRLRAT